MVHPKRTLFQRDNTHHVDDEVDHPIAAGTGGMAGGIGGAAVGTAFGGFPGTVVGGIIGAITGALAGEGIGDTFISDDDTDERYYRSEHANRPYAANRPYENYRSAYMYGSYAGNRHYGKRYEDVEPQLQKEWNDYRGQKDLGWDEASPAVRESFHRTSSLRKERYGK
ncbi:MAG: hypothetical protein AB7L92_02305 [Alphaproteobacteria bacterium]